MTIFLEEVRNSNLEAELKSYIVAQLSTIAWALANFDYLGAAAVYEIVAGIVAKTQPRAAKETSQEASEKFGKFWAVTSRFGRVLNAAIRLNQGRVAFQEMWAAIVPGGEPPALPPAGI